MLAVATIVFARRYVQARGRLTAPYDGSRNASLALAAVRREMRTIRVSSGPERCRSKKEVWAFIA
jgi:hypothetical protein